MSAMARLLAVAVLLAGLVACGAPVRPSLAPDHDAAMAQQLRREAALAAQDRWRLSGRIAVSNDGDGGSGRLEWVQDGDAFEISLRAPVTRRSWRLVGTPGFARIEGLDVGPQTAGSAEILLAEYVGWTLPLDDLRAWMRGARAQGAAQIEFDVQQRPARIRQHGWTIDYRAWGDDGQPVLPVRVFAERGGQRVRLQVDQWQRTTP